MTKTATKRLELKHTPTNSRVKTVNVDPQNVHGVVSGVGVKLGYWKGTTNFIKDKYLEFEAKHGHYLAKRNKTAEKTKKRMPGGRLMHSASHRIACTSPKVPTPNDLYIQSSNVLSPDGKDQVGDENEQSVCRRIVSRSSTKLPNDLEREDTKGKS
ncbi:hypothetical protein H5410_004947 [Solanum commersonii]|uniref:Uncharacterized protein n=1 Tax=Solanum commersonii TaxID=4109 RepID=A0A9J6A5A6_SOLCO|nr:hypothetical protein H5410_004947 [Solanum commersonii]